MWLTNALTNTITPAPSGFGWTGQNIKIMNQPNFTIVPPELVEQAHDAWSRRDATGLFILVGHQQRGRLLFDNLHGLKKRGMFETALFDSYIHGPHMHPSDWKFLFGFSNRKKLASCGDPIPKGPILVYRGISHTGHRKFIRGLSWTTNPHTASWFAGRYSTAEKTPAVYSLPVTGKDVFFMTNERSEQEVVINPWRMDGLKRLPEMPVAIKP